MVIGASIDDTFKDKYKNILTPAPIQIPNPIKGIINFLDGISNLLNGIKNKKTIPILRAPNKRGLVDAFNPNFPKGYALPKKNITSIIIAVCLDDN